VQEGVVADVLQEGQVVLKVDLGFVEDVPFLEC
jgi:hypothetical protein